MEHSYEELCGILNAQTGKLSWDELARHFARGVVIKVAADVSLVEVAAKFVRNDRQEVEKLMEAGTVTKATDTDARAWNKTNAVLWAVVVAPWVLVQPPMDSTKDSSGK